jgi:hypothetical protein
MRDQRPKALIERVHRAPVLAGRGHRSQALVECDRFDDAYVRWHADYADDPHRALAALSALSRQAACDACHQLAARYDAVHTALRRGSRWYPGALPRRALAPPDAPMSLARLRHDAQQLAYLHALGVLGDEFIDIIASYRTLAARMQAWQRDWYPVPDAEAHDDIGEVFNRIVHVRPTPCMAQLFSSGGHDGDDAGGHGVTVIDNLLSAAALGELQRFCLQSTMWFDVDDDGRLGARYENGCNCPLLVQLAHGMQQPGYAVTRIGARKSPPQCLRAPLRAHAAHRKAVVWLTPDAANRDPRSGGLFIGERYIPYRHNRAVVFDARWPHGAAACDFREDYPSWRIEVVFLYERVRRDAGPCPSR